MNNNFGSDERRAEREVEPTRQEILEAVNELNQRFSTRLAENAAANRLYDELTSQLRFAQDGLARQWLRPLFEELFLISDRIMDMTTNELAMSVSEELDEIFRRRGVSSVREIGEFDPEIHDAAQTAHDPVVPKGHVIGVLRRGYRDEFQVIRPALVVISEGPEAEASPNKESKQEDSILPNDNATLTDVEDSV